MSNNVTLVARVPVLRSTDPERPVELRFGPHTDEEGRPTEEWTVERLTLEQARHLLDDVAAMLAVDAPHVRDSRGLSVV